MTIASEITRLQTAKANIKTSIENKGVTVPSSTTLDGYSALIDSISSGASNIYRGELTLSQDTTATITIATLASLGLTKEEVLLCHCFAFYRSETSDLPTPPNSSTQYFKAYTVCQTVPNESAFASKKGVLASFGKSTSNEYANVVGAGSIITTGAFRAYLNRTDSTLRADFSSTRIAKAGHYEWVLVL